jgi:phage tail sheath protein FI
MPTAFHHGIKVTEINTGARTIQAISTAIIGLLCTAPAADEDMFPLDRPVLVTDIDAAISNAGTTGTLAQALRAIADQADPVIVVVRIAPGVDAAATTTNAIGSVVDGLATGMQAFLAAQSQLGLRPRILGAPGLDTLAVTTAFAIVAEKLGAMLYAGCDTSATIAEAITYRANFANRELMLIWPDFTGFNTLTSTTGPAMAIARAMGLRARIDTEQGWHKTLSNVPVAGVNGMTKDVQWDLQNIDSDSNLLNAAQITTLINTGPGFGGGYRFWGNSTCSDDPLFRFESAVRTAQILKDSIAQGLLWAMDKPLHPSLARDIIETINANFRSLKSQGYIVDGKATLNPAANPSTELAAGKLVIDYDFTPVAPLESLGLNQRITEKYYADFAARLKPARL